jgi:hypothetical protein
LGGREWYLGLNLGLCNCEAGILPLEPNSSLSCSDYSGDKVLLFTRIVETAVLLFYASHVAGMTGAYHHTQLFSIKMGSLEHFLSWLAWNFNLFISASCIAWDNRHTSLQPAVS